MYNVLLLRESARLGVHWSISYYSSIVIRKYSSLSLYFSDYRITRVDVIAIVQLYRCTAWRESDRGCFIGPLDLIAPPCVHRTRPSHSGRYRCLARNPGTPLTPAHSCLPLTPFARRNLRRGESGSQVAGPGPSRQAPLPGPRRGRERGAPGPARRDPRPAGPGHTDRLSPRPLLRGWAQTSDVSSRRHVA